VCLFFFLRPDLGVRQGTFSFLPSRGRIGEAGYSFIWRIAFFLFSPSPVDLLLSLPSAGLNRRLRPSPPPGRSTSAWIPLSTGPIKSDHSFLLPKAQTNHLLFSLSPRQDPSFSSNTFPFFTQVRTVRWTFLSLSLPFREEGPSAPSPLFPPPSLGRRVNVVALLKPLEQGMLPFLFGPSFSSPLVPGLKVFPVSERGVPFLPELSYFTLCRRDTPFPQPISLFSPPLFEDGGFFLRSGALRFQSKPRSRSTYSSEIFRRRPAAVPRTLYGGRAVFFFLGWRQALLLGTERGRPRTHPFSFSFVEFNTDLSRRGGKEFSASPSLLKASVAFRHGCERLRFLVGRGPRGRVRPFFLPRFRDRPSFSRRRFLFSRGRPEDVPSRFPRLVVPSFFPSLMDHPF